MFRVFEITEVIPAVLAAKSEMASACIVNKMMGTLSSIENNQVRMQIPSFLNGVKAIRSLAANVKFSLRVKIRMYELPYDGAVVDNEDTFGHAQPPDRR